MQPLSEAKGLVRQKYAGQMIPPFVCQIGDGENGGVMMNEFPPMYIQSIQSISTEGTVALNGSEYLEFLEEMGVNPADFTPVQPISQHRIWARIKKFEPQAVNKAIAELQKIDSSFNLDKGSWTSDRDWVKGYDQVLDPINQLSANFHEKFDSTNTDLNLRSYREALLYLLLSQTSCFRYWGQGIWTDYAKELCRRGLETIAQGKTTASLQSSSKPQPVFQEPQKEVSRKGSPDLLNNPQVIQEIEKHKWCESQKAGRDVGLAWAQEDWLKNYAQQWKENH